MAGHTPGKLGISPYNDRLVVVRDGVKRLIGDGLDDLGIADCSMCAPMIQKPPVAEARANAAFIMLAWNSHDHLLNGLRSIVDFINESDDGTLDDIAKQARHIAAETAALATPSASKE